MTKDNVNSRRNFLKTASAAGIAGLGGAAASAQDRPMRPAVRPARRRNLTVAKQVAAAGRSEPLSVLPRRVSDLLTRDELLSADLLEQTVTHVERLIGGLEPEFRGTITVDVSVDMEGQANNATCKINACGTNVCAGLNRCTANACSSQMCPSNSCGINVSSSVFDYAGAQAQQARQVWAQVEHIQRMNGQLADRYVEVHVVRNG